MEDIKRSLEPVTRAREFQSTVQQIYRWKEEDFRVVKIEAEMILEASQSSSVDETRFGESGECLLEQFHFEEVEDVTWCYGCSSWKIQMARMITKRKCKNDSVKGLPRLNDNNGKTHCIPCKLAKSKRVSFQKDGGRKIKTSIELLHMDLCGPMPTESQGGNKYFLSIIDDYSRKFQRQVRKTPSTSEKPDVSSDNHSLIPYTERLWIRNIGRKVTGSNVYYSIEGEATRLKSFNEIERYCKRHNIKYDPSLFNFRKDNTESQGFSDLSEQQEALMVEVTILFVTNRR
ncbi:retrovirus-related Pol polyprotein from transposon RE1 [Trichonephila clavipes]|nr:retrovirus-related Pol polyprotein from transposon RE1 [Trichonephila clavipes]